MSIFLVILITGCPHLARVYSITGPTEVTPHPRRTHLLYIWGPVGGKSWGSSRCPRGAYFEILSDVGPFEEMNGISEPQMYKCLGQLEVHVVFFRPYYANSSNRNFWTPKKAQNGRFWPFLALFWPVSQKSGQVGQLLFKTNVETEKIRVKLTGYRWIQLKRPPLLTNAILSFGSSTGGLWHPFFCIDRVFSGGVGVILPVSIENPFFPPENPVCAWTLSQFSPGL